MFLNGISCYFEANFEESLLCWFFAWTYCLCYFLSVLQLCFQYTSTLNIKITIQIFLSSEIFYCVLSANITRYFSILFVTFDLLLHHRPLPFFLHKSWPNHFLPWKILLTSIFSCPGQLNRWHCQSLIKWVSESDFWFQRYNDYNEYND